MYFRRVRLSTVDAECTVDARVTAVDRRPCVDAATGTSSTFLTLHLTDGWSFVPAIPTLEEMWEWLGSDEASYVGLRLTLTIARQDNPHLQLFVSGGRRPESGGCRMIQGGRSPDVG